MLKEIKTCLINKLKNCKYPQLYFDLIYYGCFWDSPVTYYEHKTDSYKNNKRKLMKVCRNTGFVLTPHKNESSYSFILTEGKEITDVLNKYWKEIDRNMFFEKEITHIPV